LQPLRREGFRAASDLPYSWTRQTSQKYFYQE